MSGIENLFLHSRVANAKLRVVAVTDGPWVGRPEVAALRHIAACDFATLLAVATPSLEGPPPARRASLSTLLFDGLELWDRHVYPDGYALIAPVDLSSHLAGYPTLPIGSADASGTLIFPATTLATIRDLHPDVILHCAAGPVPRALLPLASFGVWALHLAEASQPRPTVPYFYELRFHQLLSGVALLMHGGPGGQVHVLTQARVATEHSLFRGKNCVRPVLTALTFVIRKLRDLHEQGGERFVANLEALSSAPVRPSPRPGNREMLGFLAPRTLRRIAHRVSPPAQTFRWRLALRSGHARKLIDDATPEGLASFRWFLPPQGGYYADPFLVRRDGALWLFCEELSYAEGKGALCCMQVLSEGRLSPPVRVLTRPYHISYPAVFECDGEMFMIPETAQSGKVELYHAVSFPHAWVKVRDLLSLRAADCTPFFHQGRHWLFVPAIDPAESSPQLLLFHADRLDGDFTLHPSSPLSLDVRYARSAGAIVSHDGKLYRPSQDCAPYYGHQLNIHEITRLDPGGYEERLVRTVTPKGWPGLRGVHTYATMGDIEIIDGQRS